MDILEKIIVNENIYIYKKPSLRFYSKNAINKLFKAAKDDKAEQNCIKLFSEVNTQKASGNGKSYQLSLLFLKFYNNPTFLNSFISADWLEQKLAYLIILDFGTFVVILKRNISGIQDFLKTIEEIDYQVISKLLVSDTTLFEKFSTQNLDINKDVIKTKSVESDDLTTNFNYLGSNKYTLNLLRLNNDSQRYLVSTNKSRISKAGDKVGVEEVAEWCLELIDAIENFVNHDSFLDVFATPHNYEQEREKLNATAITILLNQLINDLTNGKIKVVNYEFNGRLRKIDILKNTPDSNLSFELDRDVQYRYVAVTNSKISDIVVKLNPKSISIYSKKLNNIKLYKEDGTIESLNSYFNRNQSYVINFENVEIVYSNRSLFRDSGLLGSIDTLLTIFIPDAKLNAMTSEKGTVTKSSKKFNSNCVFGYVEEKFKNNQYLMLDDFGDEWADHISIQEDKVTFIISKFSTSIFSATAFTDIIGQAQKNIGNIFPPDERLNNKRQNWSGNYKFKKVQTAIPRLRKGNNVNGFINKYIIVKQSVNPKRAICLVLNFISKRELTTNLNNLKLGNAFPEKRQTIQMLWFLSSLVSSCRENGIEISIMCKP